jgi:hypothetical protein
LDTGKSEGEPTADPATSAGFKKIDYASLNAKQKEVFNFHHIAAVLAKYGFATYPIRDDWNGGDMIARHMTDVAQITLTIQLKSRVTFGRKYKNKKLWIAFPFGAAVYVYPHDKILAQYEKARTAKGLPLDDSGAWSEGGLVHWKKPTKELLEILEPYRLEI